MVDRVQVLNSQCLGQIGFVYGIKNSSAQFSSNGKVANNYKLKGMYKR